MSTQHNRIRFQVQSLHLLRHQIHCYAVCLKATFACKKIPAFDTTPFNILCHPIRSARSTVICAHNVKSYQEWVMSVSVHYFTPSCCSGLQSGTICVQLVLKLAVFNSILSYAIVILSNLLPSLIPSIPPSHAQSNVLSQYRIYPLPYSHTRLLPCLFYSKPCFACLLNWYAYPEARLPKGEAHSSEDAMRRRWYLAYRLFPLSLCCTSRHLLRGNL